MQKEYTFLPSLNDESKLQIVFIHGLLGSQGDFLEYIKYYRKTASIILISLPGHDRNYIKNLDLDINVWILDVINKSLDPFKDTIFVTHSLSSSLLSDQNIFKYKNIKYVFHIAPIVFSNFFLNKNINLSLNQRLEIMIQNQLVIPKRIDSHEKINKGNFLKFYDQYSNYLFSENYKFSYSKISNIKILWGSDDNYIQPRDYKDIDKIINGGGHNCHISHHEEIVDFINYYID